MEFVGDGDDAAVHRHRAGDEVEVVPLQAEELAASDAGVGREPEGSEQPMAGGAPQEGLQLLRVPSSLLGLRDGTQFWGVGEEGDVAGDESGSGGFQCAPPRNGCARG